MFNPKRFIKLVPLMMIAGLPLVACGAPVTSVPATQQAAEARRDYTHVTTGLMNSSQVPRAILMPRLP